MRKFKLKKCYPGSPGLGYETKFNNNDEDWSTPNMLIIDDCIDYPEFWEEVKEKFPKIISFRRISDKMLYTLGRYDLYWGKEVIRGYTLDVMITQGENTNYTEIYQVAVSETKVFKLGDLVNNPKLQRPMPFVITKFYFDCNNEHILCNGECCGNGHVNVMKVEHYTKPEPLLVTIDGFEVFEEDYIYWVRSDYTLGESKYYHKVHIKDSYSNLKYFKNKEAAEQFISENKPIYSKKQIKEAFENSFVRENYILDVPCCCADRFKEELFVKKLGL